MLREDDMAFIEIGGVPLHYRHQRDADSTAPTLVCINSLGTDFRIWDAVVERLSPHFPILTYDKRGHGLSGLGPGLSSIGQHVDDLIGLLDALDIQDIVLCGLSIGGLISLGYLERRPRGARALILCDTAHQIGTAQIWNARIETVERDGIGSIADLVMKNWFTPDFHRLRPADLAGYRTMLVRQELAGYVGSCKAVRDADYTATAAALDLPTLCVVGDQDGSTPPALVRGTAELIPGARFDIIAGAGHIPCVEQPDALAALIHDFVG
jgi:3-oxoadipate enol-lactonase